MDDFGINQAISTLQGISEPARARASREAFVSYVWLDTLAHHWPSLATPEIRDLRDRFSELKQLEYSRYLKQRRIAVRRLSNELSASSPL